MIVWYMTLFNTLYVWCKISDPTKSSQLAISFGIRWIRMQKLSNAKLNFIVSYSRFWIHWHYTALPSKCSWIQSTVMIMGFFLKLTWLSLWRSSDPKFSSEGIHTLLAAWLYVDSGLVVCGYPNLTNRGPSSSFKKIMSTVHFSYQ